MARNSTFLKAKAGDIIHFSSFYNLLTVHYWEHDVWAVVTKEREAEGCRVMIAKFTGEEPGGDYDADETDTGRIVAPDEVPDWVWAALAKWRLIGADPA